MSFVAEAVHLIKQLYAPINPSEVSPIEKRILELQHAHGWELANALLYNDDQNVRFTGCRTYQVAINDHGSSLDEAHLESLLTKLLDWFMRCVEANDSPLVLRKLCSTLVTYFMLPNATWTTAIRHIICCLQLRQALPKQMLERCPPTKDLLQLLRPAQLQLLLIFVTDLAVDAARIDHTQQSDATHQRIGTNLDDALTIIEYNLDGAAEQTADSLSDTLKCYGAWLTYGRQEHAISSEEMQKLRHTFGKVIQCLAFEELFESVAEFLIEQFSGGETFLSETETREFAALLAGPWAQNLMSRLETDADYEAMAFAQLVLSFGETSARFILKDLNYYAHIMEMAHRITRTQDVNEIDQALSNLVVDYWETMTSMADSIDRVDGGLRLIGTDWMHAIMELCFAIILPTDDNGEFKTYKHDDLITDFRYRVRDVILDSFSRFGVVVLTKLITMAIECFNVEKPPHCWPMIESIFYCLNGMPESLDTSGQEDIIVSQLFTSQIYKDLVDFRKPIPTKLRRSAILLIGEFDQFFNRHPDFLINGIETLFSCLRFPLFSEDAARAILGLCDLNREALVPKLDAFVNITAKFFESGVGDAKARENICGSLAAIIQAIEDEAERMTAITKLIVFVNDDYKARATALMASGDTEGLQELKIQTLAQLKSIGDQSRDPQETSIDLTAPNEIANDELWSTCHNLIISLLSSIIGDSMNDPQIFPLVCEVLEMGYKERIAGAFVFAPEVTITLLTTTDISNPRIDAAIRTANTFISSNNSKPGRIDAFLPQILPWICRLVVLATGQAAPNAPPSTPDSDFVYNVIDFLSRMIPKHLTYFNPVPPAAINTLFSLTLHALGSPETLPKRAAAGLWTDPLSLPVSSPSLPLLTHLLGTLGPQLVHTLIFSFGGHASRSQLDWLSEPYRKLVARGAQLGVPWKQWTELALADSRFGYAGREGRVPGLEKQRFVKKVENLRGDRKTKEVIKEFWLGCRGISAGYG